MELSFFQEVVSRICGSLDISKALQRSLVLMKEYIPVEKLVLHIYDHSTNTAEVAAYADFNGSRKTHFKFSYSSKVREDMIKRQKQTKKRLWHIHRLGEYEGTRDLAQKTGNADRGASIIDLVLEGEHIGLLTIIHEKDAVFSIKYDELLNMLNEPFAIALSNYSRYWEIRKLRDILTDDYLYLQNELNELYGTDVVGADSGLKQVMQMVQQVAPLISPVLLLGETGVGKEVIAGTIHKNSPRRNGPFIRVNCGTIPETLMESELFGHEKGAFTGASARKRGRFERAQGGTIFLDEIGELTISSQVHLLRVLQEKEIERVGGTDVVNVDIRVIAATHRNLEKMIKEGTFREDLYFRLKVFPVIIPPLRKRINDIPLLVSHFLQKKSKEMKIAGTSRLAPGGIDQLMSYNWPGNVRELENTIERALILFKDNPISFEGFDFMNKAPHQLTVKNEEQPLLPLSEAVAGHIRRALRETGGKISGTGGAAEKLGLNPMTLRNKMKKLGIPFGKKTKHLYKT